MSLRQDVSFFAAPETLLEGKLSVTQSKLWKPAGFALVAIHWPSPTLFFWCFLTQLHHKISGKCQSVERRLRLQQLKRWALKRLEWPQTFAQFGTYVKSDMFGSLWT
jgi:hypothetical protein